MTGVARNRFMLTQQSLLQARFDVSNSGEDLGRGLGRDVM
jgi:hypothetical protein